MAVPEVALEDLVAGRERAVGTVEAPARQHERDRGLVGLPSLAASDVELEDRRCTGTPTEEDPELRTEISDGGGLDAGRLTCETTPGTAVALPLAPRAQPLEGLVRENG